jgi:hypothetical protein
MYYTILDTQSLSPLLSHLLSVFHHKTQARVLEVLKFSLASARIGSREYNFKWILFDAG